MESTIPALREEIDSIDREIVGLIAHRIEKVRSIGELKKAQSLQVMDRDRERIKMRAILGHGAKYEIPPLCLAIIFRSIMEVSKRIQSNGSTQEGQIQMRTCVACDIRSAGLLDEQLSWRVCPICREPLL